MTVPAHRGEKRRGTRLGVRRAACRAPAGRGSALVEPAAVPADGSGAGHACRRAGGRRGRELCGAPGGGYEEGGSGPGLSEPCSRRPAGTRARARRHRVVPGREGGSGRDRFLSRGSCATHLAPAAKPLSTGHPHRDPSQSNGPDSRATLVVGGAASVPECGRRTAAVRNARCGRGASRPDPLRAAFAPSRPGRARLPGAQRRWPPQEEQVPSALHTPEPIHLEQGVAHRKPISKAPANACKARHPRPQGQASGTDRGPAPAAAVTQRAVAGVGRSGRPARRRTAGPSPCTLGTP